MRERGAGHSPQTHRDSPGSRRRDRHVCNSLSILQKTRLVESGRAKMVSLTNRAVYFGQKRNGSPKPRKNETLNRETVFKCGHLSANRALLTPPLHAVRRYFTRQAISTTQKDFPISIAALQHWMAEAPGYSPTQKLISRSALLPVLRYPFCQESPSSSPFHCFAFGCTCRLKRHRYWL